MSRLHNSITSCRLSQAWEQKNHGSAGTFVQKNIKMLGLGFQLLLRLPPGVHQQKRLQSCTGSYEPKHVPTKIWSPSALAQPCDDQLLQVAFVPTWGPHLVLGGSHGLLVASTDSIWVRGLACAPYRVISWVQILYRSDAVAKKPEIFPCKLG